MAGEDRATAFRFSLRTSLQYVKWSFSLWPENLPTRPKPSWKQRTTVIFLSQSLFCFLAWSATKVQGIAVAFLRLRIGWVLISPKMLLLGTAWVHLHQSVKNWTVFSGVTLVKGVLTNPLTVMSADTDICTHMPAADTQYRHGLAVSHV